MARNRSLFLVLCLACGACFAYVAYFAGPAKATILPLPVALNPVGALPTGQWQLLASTRSFHTKGWTTVEIEDLSQLNGLKLEVEVGSDLPSDCHLHVAVFPLTMITDQAFIGIPQPDTPVGKWPHSNDNTAELAAEVAQVQTVTVSDWWMRDEPGGFFVFQDTLHAINAPYADLGPFSSTADPSEWSDIPLLDATQSPAAFPIVGYKNVKAMKSRLGWEKPHPTNLKGKEFSPGETIVVDLTEVVKNMQGARIAFACYHQDPVTGVEQIFNMYPTDHAVSAAPLQPVSTYDYQNNPYFLWLPWNRNMTDPATRSTWLTHDTFLRRSMIRPSMWDIFGRINNILPSDTNFWFRPSFMFPPASGLLDWDRLLGDETSQWLLAWNGAMFDVGRGRMFQQHPLRVMGEWIWDSPTLGHWEWDSDGSFEPYVTSIHALLAQWFHLGYHALFQFVPYYESGLPSDLPEIWMTPAGYGQGGLKWNALNSASQAAVATPTWYENRFASWTVPTDQTGLRWGLGQPVGTAANDPEQPLFMWAPNLPLAFGQTRLLNSPELWQLIFMAHAKFWQANDEFGAWFGNWRLVYEMISDGTTKTGVADWLADVGTLPMFKTMNQDDVWPVADMSANLWDLLYFYNPGWSGGYPVQFVDWWNFYYWGTTTGMGPLVQPKHYVTTAQYLVGKVKVWGRYP